MSTTEKEAPVTSAKDFLAAMMVTEHESESEREESTEEQKEEPEHHSPAREPSSEDKEKPESNVNHKREHAKIYQRQYRMKQKNEMERLKNTQIRGSELLLVSQNGDMTSRQLITEDDYLDMMEGFLQALKEKQWIISYRLSKSGVRHD